MLLAAEFVVLLKYTRRNNNVAYHNKPFSVFLRKGYQRSADILSGVWILLEHNVNLKNVGAVPGTWLKGVGTSRSHHFCHSDRIQIYLPCGGWQ